MAIITELEKVKSKFSMYFCIPTILVSCFWAIFLITRVSMWFTPVVALPIFLFVYYWDYREKGDITKKTETFYTIFSVITLIMLFFSMFALLALETSVEKKSIFLNNVKEVQIKYCLRDEKTFFICEKATTLIDKILEDNKITYLEYFKFYYSIEEFEKLNNERIINEEIREYKEKFLNKGQ